MKKILPGLAALLIISCSVKEDRSACPAWLRLSLSERSIAISGGKPVRVQVLHGGAVDSLTLDASAPDAWIAADRGELRVEGFLANGASYYVPWGVQSDSLWAFASSGSLVLEEGAVEVELHKRFATIWFEFDSAPLAEGASLLVRSDNSGTDLTRMSPAAGDFCCLVRPSKGECSVRLPVQSDDAAIELDCISGSGNALLWNWDLAGALRKAGYDWGADDLADARVRVSLAPLEAGVEIIPWQGSGGLTLEF